MLDVADIDLSYGASRCLRGVSPIAQPGQVTAVLGRNGVGKISLLRAIMGLERVQRGRVTWEGQDITRLPPAERARAGIGYVPQGREIFPFLTVQENLETAWPRRRADQRCRARSSTCSRSFASSCAGEAATFPAASSSSSPSAVRSAPSPRLLILDEPTEGIQPSVIKDISRVIRYLARDRRMAVVLVEQYYDFARELADRVLVMVRGEVAMEGSTGSLDEVAVRRLLTV